MQRDRTARPASVKHSFAIPSGRIKTSARRSLTGQARTVRNVPVSREVLVQAAEGSRCPARVQERVWFPGQDSNLDKQFQRLRCYHYTTRDQRGDTAELHRRPNYVPIRRATQHLTVKNYRPVGLASAP